MAMLVITRGYCSLSAEKCWTSPQPQDVPEVLFLAPAPITGAGRTADAEPGGGPWPSLAPKIGLKMGKGIPWDTMG